MCGERITSRTVSGSLKTTSPILLGGIPLREGTMAARVELREITNEEGNRLLRIIRRGSGSVVTWRRAQIVLLAAPGHRGRELGRVEPVQHGLDDKLLQRVSERRDVAATREARLFGADVAARPSRFGAQDERLPAHPATKELSRASSRVAHSRITTASDSRTVRLSASYS